MTTKSENVERIELLNGFYWAARDGCHDLGDIRYPDGATFSATIFRQQIEVLFKGAMRPQPTASAVECANRIFKGHVHPILAEQPVVFDMDEAAAIIQSLLDAETAKLREEVAELKKAQGWLVKIVQGFEDGDLKDVSLIVTADDGSRKITSMKKAIMDDMKWFPVSRFSKTDNQTELSLSDKTEGK